MFEEIHTPVQLVHVILHAVVLVRVVAVQVNVSFHRAHRGKGEEARPHLTLFSWQAVQGEPHDRPPGYTVRS